MENKNNVVMDDFDRMREEIAYYEENKDCFGYVFYIGRKM